MSDNSVARFIQFLTDNAVKWSDVMGDPVGVRAVTIGGDFLRGLYASNKVDRFWDVLKTKVPSDIVIMDCGGQVLLQGISGGMYNDSHILLLGSKEWPVDEPGSMIEPFEVLFDRADFE